VQVLALEVLVVEAGPRCVLGRVREIDTRCLDGDRCFSAGDLLGEPEIFSE
jgi:hypothetical protein